MLDLSAGARMQLMQTIQVCFSISSILVFVRFFDTLSIFPALGELVTILIAMIKDGGSIYVILLWSGLGFAAAFTALLPQANLSTEYFLRPFWYSFRAILGDFDISTVYEIVGDADAPQQNMMGFVAVVLLYLYGFLTTIVIVNLMIAQMTQAYERIREESILFRKYRQVDLIREYKDKRSPLPPPFILFHFLFKVVGAIFGLGGRPRRESEVEEGFSDYVWHATAEKLLKKECAFRDKYVQSQLLAHSSDHAQKIDELYAEQSRLSAEMQKNFEVNTGRFDRIEDRLKRLADLLAPPKQRGGASGDGDPRDGIGLGRPAYVSPAQLVPINYTQDAAGQYASAKGYAGGGGGLYPPTSSRPRCAPLQAAPSGVPSGALPGAVPAALRRSAPSTLAGIAQGARESSAYLSSVAGLPITAHRQPARTRRRTRRRRTRRRRRRAGGAQYDLQLMDHARRVFGYYDRNGSGDMDARELQPALRDLGLVNVDSAQASAILARYDTNADLRLDFVEFTQLLHELREFQSAANQAAAGPRAVGGAGGGGAGGGGGVGCGGGYYTSEEVAELQAQARRAAQAEERARLDGVGRLASLDAGPPP